METKYIPISELKVGTEIHGYKNGRCTCVCLKDVDSIKNNTVFFKYGDPLENASDYMFSVKMTDEEKEEKYKAEIQEIKDALNHNLGQVDGTHEMWNTWLYAGDLADMASELNKNDLRLVGYATLTSPKHSAFTGEVYDIGIVAELNNGERIWCHATEKYRKQLLNNFDLDDLE